MILSIPNRRYRAPPSLIEALRRQRSGDIHTSLRVVAPYMSPSLKTPAPGNVRAPECEPCAYTSRRLGPSAPSGTDGPHHSSVPRRGPVHRHDKTVARTSHVAPPVPPCPTRHAGAGGSFWFRRVRVAVLFRVRHGRGCDRPRCIRMRGVRGRSLGRRVSIEVDVSRAGLAADC